MGITASPSGQEYTPMLQCSTRNSMRCGQVVHPAFPLDHLYSPPQARTLKDESRAALTPPKHSCVSEYVPDGTFRRTLRLIKTYCTIRFRVGFTVARHDVPGGGASWKRKKSSQRSPWPTSALA